MNPHASPLSLLVRASLLQMGRRVRAAREQSRLLSSLIGFFVVGYLALSFKLFHKGLVFLNGFPGLGTLLMERLIYLLFAFLFVMLLFSNLVIAYTNLFRNREAQWLLTLPIPADAVFRWKFIESTMLASWAFLFLVAPLLGAYGLTRGVPWHFYPVTTLLVALYIVLPGVMGAVLAILLARFMERRLFQILVLGAALAALAAAAVWLKPEPLPPDMQETRVLAVLDKMLLKTRFAEQPWLPSYWLSSGVLHWAEGALMAAGFFALVLLSHALFFGFLALTGLGRAFYGAASAVQSRGSVLGHWEWARAWGRRRARRPHAPGWLDRLLARLPLGPDVRALVAKDLRMFWRDTTQWGQTIMLFGLLGVYVINLRHFTSQLSNPFWIHLVSYLNLAACSLNLATLTTRFVYPQFSLEGKRVWIVGMAPLGLAQVVRVKFWLATLTSLSLTLGLMWLSCHMLRMPLDRTLFFSLAITVMTLTLNGLATGLGVLYPNLREDNPGKIVSGFGGTFCLVMSFLYIVASVVLLAMASPLVRGGAGVWLPTTCLAGFLAISALVGWVPLRAASHRLEKFEV